MAGIASAQENIFRAKPGARQFGTSGGLFAGEGITRFSVMLEGGYYLTDRLVAVGRVGIVRRSPTNYGMAFGLRYDFSGGGGFVPYVFSMVEYHRGALDTQGSPSRPQPLIYQDPNDPNATFLQGGLGTNFFLNTNTALFLEVSAIQKTGGNPIGTNLEIGLRVFFK